MSYKITNYVTCQKYIGKNPKRPTLNWHTHTCIHTTTVHKNTIYIIHSNHIWPPPTLHKYMYLLLNEVELSQWQHDEDKDNAESGCQEADVLGNRTITLVIKAEHTQPTQLVRDISPDSNNCWPTPQAFSQQLLFCYMMVFLYWALLLDYCYCQQRKKELSLNISKERKLRTKHQQRKKVKPKHQQRKTIKSKHQQRKKN